ncbi:MAG TPA: DUF1990 domain-containing protein [Blastocatellia bacterium]|nr:DUF1990 domain-containing protein [Blastocatellia bacterium]
MFFLTKPSRERIQRLINLWRKAPFNYAEVGRSLGPAPAGYAVNHGRICLGQGEATFKKAVDALRSWKMFDLGWANVCWSDAEIEVGTTVAVLARHFGFWSLHPSRIVFLVDEDDGRMRRRGFAYGTLQGHGERGEETFIIEWLHADDSVWYDLRSFSKPGRLLTALGLPLARMLQRRFARESTQTMLRTVGEGRSD